MNVADSAKFRVLVTQVMSYYGKDVTDFTLQVFWDGLKDFSLDDVSKALSIHARDADKGQWSPKVADIVRILEGGNSDRAAMAWSKVGHAIRCVGPYQTIIFDDPLVHAVITEMGGFSKLCDVNTEDMPFREKDFVARYRNYSSRGVIPQYPPKIVGEHEADCMAKALPQWVPDAVMIGDVEKCLQVMRSGTFASVTQVTTAALSGALAASMSKKITHKPEDLK